MTYRTTALLRHLMLLLSVGLLAACGQDERDLAERSSLGLALQRPDALIESASLGSLPKDLLSVPLLRDTLTEDLLFYYQSNADRLGLLGSLRRIIYEHDLQLRDSLLDELLDQPAEVALWRGEDGKLKHFLLLIQRGGLAKLLEPLAHIALDDSQLSQVAELRVDGAKVALYRLNYLANRSLLLASYGDKLLLMSDPGMLLADDQRLARDASESVESLLDGDDPFPARFALEPRQQQQQRIVIGGEYLALGYQRLLPALAGLRFEKSAQGWSSYLALRQLEDQAQLDFTPIWQSMPLGASACVAVPVARESIKALLAGLGVDNKAGAELQKQLGSSAGLCWYPDSRLHSPLLVTQLKQTSAQLDATIGGLFEQMVGAYEPNAPGGRLPVSSRSDGDNLIWQREVGSNFGPYPAAQSSSEEFLVSQGFFRISLARQDKTLLFSLDERLLLRALDTLHKRFPAMAEVLPKKGPVPAYLAPEGLAQLFEQETLEALPASYEPVLRNAAQVHLLPKLKALGNYPPLALSLPGDSEADDDWQWLPLEWNAL